MAPGTPFQAIPLPFFVTASIALLAHSQAAKFDVCGPKPGVVTTAKAASVGASLLTKCGRKLLLKYSIKTDALAQGFSLTCTVLQLCSTYHDNLPNNQPTYANAMTKCFVKVLKLKVKFNPELEDAFSGSLEEMMNSTEKCMREGFLGNDVKVSLAMVRYVRSVILMNGRG
ncbi:uncharacterized protein LOC144167777 [Haemaphysalis longicornis]